jgi:L-iditol 2-dehydrogenase
MKELVMPTLGQLALSDAPTPRPGEGEVLLKTRGAAIFRSEFIPLLRGADPRTREGEFLYRGFPFRFVADTASEIAELGSRVEGFSIGERVSVAVRLAEFAVAPASRLVRLAPHLSDEEGTFPVHAGVVLNGIRKLWVQIGDTGLVIGQGPLGIIGAQWLKIAGAGTVIGADLHDGRLERARHCGVSSTINTRNEDLQQRVRELTGGRGADVVVEATAAAPCVEMALEAVREHGQVLILGFHAFPFTIANPIYNLLRKEVTIVGTFASGGSAEVSRYTAAANWQVAADMLAQGRLVVRPLVSHRLPFNDVIEAFRLLEEEPDTTMRVHLEFAGRDDRDV